MQYARGRTTNRDRMQALREGVKIQLDHPICPHSCTRNRTLNTIGMRFKIVQSHFKVSRLFGQTTWNESVTTVRPASTYAADKNPRNPSEARGEEGETRDGREEGRERGRAGWRVAPLIIAELRKGEIDRQTKESKAEQREREGETKRRRRRIGKKKERERETGEPGEILTMQLRLPRVSGRGADGGLRRAQIARTAAADSKSATPSLAVIGR